ncbi:MAG TPA: insulinase family protein [Patescibacteria group bacterium]|nr:insulinase family protein [Patescibacteria group bacterium]
MRDPLFFEEYELPGGARLFHQHREMPWCGIVALVMSGHMHDPIGKEGTAHLLEHHVSSGRIGGLPPMSSEVLREWLADNRMMANLGKTSLYWTNYGGRAENENVAALARFLTDLVFRPGLDGDLEHDREIVRAERVDGYDGRDDRIAEMVRRACYGGQRRFTATGLPRDEVLDTISRADIGAFHRRHYASANVRIVSIGGVGMDEMRRNLEALLPPQLPGQAKACPVEPLALRPPDPRELRVPREDGRPAEMVSICMAWRKPIGRGRVRGAAADAVSALLHQRVRERLRAVYHIEACTSFEYDHVVFEIFTKTSADKVRLVREEIVRTMRDFEGIARVFRRQSVERERSGVYFDLTCGDILESAVFQVGAFGRVTTHAQSRADERSVTETDVISYLGDLDPDEALTLIVEQQ